MESLELVRRSTTLIKFIKTVVNQLPQYIKEYSPEEQVFLKEFRILLVKCVSKANLDRKTLSKELGEFNQNLRRGESYYLYPFLWFVGEYFSIANLLLNAADYHAENYFAYLVKHLRTNSEIKGVFQLIRESVPLNDLKWEELQYVCNEIYPLSEMEVDCLKEISTMIQRENLDSLNSTKVRALIKEKVDSKLSRNLKQFLNPFQTNWGLWFYHLAFGINIFFFQIKLTGFRDFRQLFDYNSPKSSVFGLSGINRLNEFQNTYIGTIFTPDHLHKKFFGYLQNLEKNGKIIIQEFTRIKDFKFSSSLALYTPNKGWSDFTNTEWLRLCRILRESNPLSKDIKPVSFFLSSQQNPNWNFRKHTNSDRAIRVYINFPRTFTVDTLPFSLKSLAKKRFTKREKAHVTEMFYNKVVSTIFYVNRLITSFSLDLYCIKMPNIPFDRLKFFLSYLPISYLFFSDSHIYIFAQLTKNLVSRITTDQNWRISSIIPVNTPQKRNSDWFDFENLLWKSPEFLKKK